MMDKKRQALFDERKMAKARKARGLNQIDLAKIIGKNRVTISDFERGKVSPSMKTAASIAKALGVEIDALHSAEPEQMPVDSGDLTGRERRVVEIMRTIPEELQQRLVGYAEGLDAREGVDG